MNTTIKNADLANLISTFQKATHAEMHVPALVRNQKLGTVSLVFERAGDLKELHAIEDLVGSLNAAAPMSRRTLTEELGVNIKAKVLWGFSRLTLRGNRAPVEAELRIPLISGARASLVLSFVKEDRAAFVQCL